MTNSPEYPSSRDKGSTDSDLEAPLVFEPKRPASPEVGTEGRLASVEEAMADINHLKWAMNNLGDELLPGAATFDKQAAESLAAVIIHSMKSLETSLDAVFRDLDITRSIKPPKE